ncbi:MAG TPA: DUF1501 domain-containing protein [Oculatellaceae cyanobacterium]
MNRREFLKAASLSTLSLMVPGLAGWAYSSGIESANKKLIVILLRGGVDGLNIVAPYGDSMYYSLRPRIAVARPGSENGLIDLDSHFGLHPALSPLMPYWQNKTLAFVHSSGSPAPSRSHFDAQDNMESGAPGVRSVTTGWLNRLVSSLPSNSNSSLHAISIGPVLPRIMSGPASIATISKGVQVNKSLLDRPVVASVFQDLYGSRNDELGKAFKEGMAAHQEINDSLSQPDDRAAMMDREQVMANRGAPLPGSNKAYGKQLAQLFRKSPSIQVAFLDFGGFDTHVNEGTGKGQLANHLLPLGQGIADLIEGLGPMYKDTTIVVMSEFGRTAKENGNSGTDHGHGNVMWVLGGDIPGGNVYARWAGLNPTALHEARDLPTSTDFRAVLSYLMNSHMHVSKATLGNVFPDFASAGNPFVQV